MRFILFILSLVTLVSFNTPSEAREEGIAAVVNQDAITMTDLNDRLKMMMTSSGLPDNPQIRQKLQPQIMDILISEQLMLQEAKKQEIVVSDAEIQQGFAQIATQNKIPVEQFQQAIARSGINLATMRRQIRAQMAWSKVVQKVMRPQITVTDADIDEYLNQMKSNQGKPEYLVAEIFLPVDAPEQEGDVRQLANNLVNEMRANKAPFFKVAQQFSKAPGAAQGGDRGWIQEGQLPEELDATIKTLEKGSISAPVRTSAGYHILLVRETRAVTAESMPDREKVYSAIGLQRLERMQRRYMMDLKSSAFIEKRVAS